MGNPALQLKRAEVNVGWILEHADSEVSSQVSSVGGNKRIMRGRLYSSLKYEQFCYLQFRAFKTVCWCECLVPKGRKQ